MNISENAVTNGAWGPFVYTTPFGYELLYKQNNIVAGTVVTAIRTFQYQETECRKFPVTFIINTAIPPPPPPPATALNELERTPLFKYYPNPAADYLFIEQSDNQHLSIELSDALGRKMRTLSSSQKSISIDVRNLASGLYWMAVYNDSLVRAVRKIIIHHNSNP